MLIALGSVKASPGVTVSTLALAAFRPGAAGVVIEADPAGGDVKAWRALPGEPGLQALAAEARHSPDADLAAAHASELPGGLRVVTAATAVEQSASAVGVLASSGAHYLRAAAAGGAPVLVDLGRLDPSSPALGILPHADRVLVVLRPSLVEVTRVMERLDALARLLRPGAGMSAILVGSGYPVEQVERSLGIPVAATLPEDRTAALAIAGLGGAGRGLSRSKLARAARAAWSRIEAPLAPSADSLVPDHLASLGASS